MPDWKEILHKYITGITQNNGHKLLAINAMYDHVHMLVDFNTTKTAAELMRLVKGDSAEFINKKGFTPVKFHWQSGYGAFTVSLSNIDKQVKYILDQEHYHRHVKFRAEFIKILQDNGVEFEERYIFEELVE